MAFSLWKTVPSSCTRRRITTQKNARERFVGMIAGLILFGRILKKEFAFRKKMSRLTFFKKLFLIRHPYVMPFIPKVVKSRGIKIISRLYRLTYR